MTTPLSDERIAEIRERCDKATPGPWSVDEESGDVWVPSIWRSVAIIEDLDLPLVNPAADRAFIAAARQDVPDLLAEVERLCGIVQWRDALADVADDLRGELGKSHEGLKNCDADVTRLRARIAELEDVYNRAQAMADRMAEQAADNLLRAREAERRVARLEGVLREVEWAECQMDSALPRFCPECQERYPERGTPSHGPYCRLDAALRGAE